MGRQSVLRATRACVYCRGGVLPADGMPLADGGEQGAGGAVSGQRGGWGVQRHSCLV
jgi:hypothetical protein